MKIKNLITLLITVLTIACCAIPASASIPEDYYNQRKIPETRQKPRLVDDADILTQDEEEKLLQKLDRISENNQVDVVVVTIKSLGSRSPREYADDYYDYNGFGFGPNKDGFVLLLAMDSRDRWFSGKGFGIEIYTDYGQQDMWDKVTPLLSSGDYYEAFNTYADLSLEFIQYAKNGTPFDVATAKKLRPKSAFPPPIWICIAIGGGAIIALIYCMLQKGQLTSVTMQHGARDYFREGSFKLTGGRDTFLYKSVSKTYIPPSDSSGRSGGGTSTHSSSSGSFHSGSGGKF